MFARELSRAVAQRGRLDVVYQALSDHWTLILQRLFPVWAVVGPGLADPGHIELTSRTVYLDSDSLLGSRRRSSPGRSRRTGEVLVQLLQLALALLTHCLLERFAQRLRGRLLRAGAAARRGARAVFPAGAGALFATRAGRVLSGVAVALLGGEGGGGPSAVLARIAVERVVVAVLGPDQPGRTGRRAARRRRTSTCAHSPGSGPSLAGSHTP